MYISIGRRDAPPANFAIGSVSSERSEDGAPLVVAVVHNTGGRTLDISGHLTLSNGPGGLNAGPFPVTLEAALSPGDSQSATARLDNRLPRGPWLAEIRLRTGFVERTATATITFPAHVVAAKPPTATAAESRRVIVGVILVLLALLAVAAAALLHSRRAPRGRGGGVGPAAPVCD
jgi:hypothetical protein